MTIAGLILMGGKNRRMGGEKKAFLIDEGRPFYQCMADAMPGMKKIYLSVEDKSRYSQLEYPMLEDLYPGIGPMGGILSSLKQCEEEALLVLPCDMPRLSCRFTERLMEVWEREKMPACIYVDKRPQPLIGIYSKECVPLMEQMVGEGNYRMSSILDQIDHVKVGAQADETVFFNVNTKEEYRKMRAEDHGRPVMIAVSGVKNSGKTTFMENLIPRLTEMGLKTAAIKHDGHTFTPDVPGTDSDRHRKAGAIGTAVFSENQFMVVKKEKVTEMKLAELFPEADVILLEGMKDSDYPKFELVRKGNSETGVCRRETILAYVTDLEMETEEITVLGLNDYEKAAELVYRCYLEQKG
ncbi:molybdopterin-guanine dinucleotide biosynthesis protein B [Clostridium sp. MCC353]|uniref:molybdopterin-guanine dinucleotide biosynthesis protein B n=1 Tax=Clostridium sp. MCC353 TaxID=2592646 RepID=UPI001C013DEE|nr:molybdopterin-guanine dinucleotide biosynthesis protein B [Clostridium sp. MCC353]